MDDDKRFNPTSNYSQKPGYVPQPGFAPQSGYAPQPAYPPQSDSAPYGSVYANDMPPPNQHLPNDQEPIVKGFEFSDTSIRRGFIRKVYSILSLQLSVTLAFVLMCTHHETTHNFVGSDAGVIIGVCALVLVLITIISISCCEGVRRTSPTNIIFLSLFTVGESYLVGLSTIQYEPEIVNMAILFTTVVVVALTVFAMQTKWDFTTMGGALFVTLWIFVLMSFMMMFTRSNVAIMIFSSIGAILFSIYLIHDTQLIMGGEHKYSISPEEYVLGAITLFLDIINIFLYILRILGAASKN